MAENTSSKAPITILLVLSVLANIILGYFLFSKSGENRDLGMKVSTLEARVDSLTTIGTTLTTRVEETSLELDEFRGLSTELDSLLTVAKKDIADKEANIRTLRKDASRKKELEKELAELKQMRDRYIERIDSLIQTNNLLQEEIITYQANIQEMTAVRQNLEKTVERGSILATENVTATPYKQKGSGKMVTTAIATKAKMVEVCFDVMENKIATPGEKIVYLQIMSPQGVTLGTDASGAGTFTVRDDSSTIRYTTAAKINYENKRKNYCVKWKNELPLPRGNYNVKVYADGFFSGAGGFILK